MNLRVWTTRFAAAFVLVSAMLGVSSASAQTQLACNYDHYGRPYNCQAVGVVVQPQYQSCSCCSSCGNRGLFTSQVQPCGSYGYAGYGQCGGVVVLQQPQVFAQPQVVIRRPIVEETQVEEDDYIEQPRRRTIYPARPHPRYTDYRIDRRPRHLHPVHSIADRPTSARPHRLFCTNMNGRRTCQVVLPRKG